MAYPSRTNNNQISRFRAKWSKSEISLLGYEVFSVCSDASDSVREDSEHCSLIYFVLYFLLCTWVLGRSSISYENMTSISCIRSSTFQITFSAVDFNQDVSDTSPPYRFTPCKIRAINIATLYREEFQTCQPRGILIYAVQYPPSRLRHQGQGP
jgi:hypothetical protein